MNDDKTVNERTIDIQHYSYFPHIPELKNWKNYEVTRILKKNNQCVIYLIKNNEEKFVLKIFYPYSPFNLEAVKRIYELSRNSDFPPYLTKIIEWGFDENLKLYYIVEEYLEYGDLLNWLKNKDLTSKEVRDFIFQMNEGLNYLHTNGIIHNDIKPSNILIRSENPLIFSISDYNIASYKPRETDIKGTSFKLTPAYAAPERFTNITSPSSDYWSLGITIFEIITHRNPFENIEPSLIAYKILTQGIEIPSTVSEPFKTLIKNLTINNPKLRWTYGDLKNFLEGKEVSKNDNDILAKPEVKIIYRNKEYKTIEELLLSFLKNQEEFKEGVRLIKSEEIQQILSLEDKQKIEKIMETIKDEELALNFFINYKIPSLPPYILSQKFSFETIINVLRKVKNRNILYSEDKKIIQLLKNYLENKNPSLGDVYDFYSKTHPDMELETFLINLKRFIVPAQIDDNAIYKLAFTLLAFVEKNYFLPIIFQNFNITRDVFNIYVPIVDDLLTVEEFNELRIKIKPSDPDYPKFQYLNTLNLEYFLIFSNYFKRKLYNVEQSQNFEKYFRILSTLRRYLLKYGIVNTEIENFIRNPTKLDKNTFDRLYNYYLDVLVEKINISSNGFPGIGIGIAAILFFISLFLMIFSIFLCFILPYPIRYVLEDFLLICFVMSFFLVLLSPVVGGFLVVLQKIIGHQKRKITKEELQKMIEKESF